MENRYGRNVTISAYDNKVFLYCGHTIVKAKSFKELVVSCDAILTIFDSTPWEENFAKRIVTGIVLRIKQRAKHLFSVLKKH